MSPDSNKLESAPPPYVDCIQWIPRRFAGGPSPVTLADLVFSQATLKIVRDAVSSRPNHSVFGLLLGDVLEDPTCSRPWVRITGVHDGPSLSGDPSATSLGAVLDGLLAGLSEEHAGSIVGWYRSHPGAGLYLSPEEARFHEEQFADPWGFSMILVGDTGRLTGSVFQRTDPEGLSRSVYTPFYELVDGSSEFNGNTKRTFIDWPNYQTETRVVQAGLGSVSAQIPDAQAHIEAVAVPKPVAPPVPQAVAAERVSTPTPANAAGQGEQTQEDAEAEWEKKQIQRSLTAVGRSIGSVSPRDFDTQVPVELEEKVATAETVADGGPAADESADSDERYPFEDRSVIPIRPSATRSSPKETGLVGRSRRSKAFPTMKIASAAAGIALLGAAGWFGSRMVGNEVAALDESSTQTARGSAAAGLGLAPTDLFRADAEPASIDEPEVADTAERGAEEVPSRGLSASEVAALRRPSAADRELSRLDEALQIPSEIPTEVVTDEPQRRPRSPQIADAPDLSNVELADPEISAFQNALAIHQQEAERYEGLRLAFDQGEESCNPLNLAARGSQDSFDRLERRFQAAAERIDAPGLRAFEAANRRTAMIAAHYGLTDCPTSPR